MNQNLFDCLFINRGSIDRQNLGIVENTAALNNNIRAFQEELLKRITTYLNQIVQSSPNLRVGDDIRDLLQDPHLYKEVNGEYYNTRILEKLKPLISRYLSPSNYNADILRQLYNDLNNTSISSDTKQRAKEQLYAYNARVFLDNFDTYLTVLFDDKIQIRDFNIKTGKDKYQMAGKVAKLMTTWRTNDNINVEGETDVITKLGINTTPMLYWQSSTPIGGQFLTFQQYSHIIAKIKDLSKLEEASNIVFNSDYVIDNDSIWETLSNKTQKLLYNRNLSDVINLLRQNPREYLDSIFDILTNDAFYRSNINGLYKNFSTDELNKLYSISKGLFNGPTSLRALSNVDSENDYYAYLTQTADGIFNINYVQYYRDQDGVIKARTLMDQGVYNLRRSIEQTINTRNAKSLIKDYNTYINYFQILPITSGNDFKGISYTIPNTTIRVTVMASSGSVSFIDAENNSPVNFLQLWEDSNIMRHIEQVLHLGISNNQDFKNSLHDIIGEYSIICKDLLSFAGRVVMNQYVSNKIINNLSYKQAQEQLELIYNSVPKYNYALDEMGLFHTNDLGTLKNLAQAKANIQGITTASQVRDGLGNGQSRQTLSRLLGSYLTQHTLQEKRDNSASKDFAILKIPGLLEDVYTVKEFYDSNGDEKEFTSMTVGEMFNAGFLQDFVKGFIYENDNSDLVGNGHFLFLPSVNSDKSTIGRIRVNLNKTILINGVKKQFIELTNEEIQQVISNELGQFYKNIYESITNDTWSKLDQFIKEFCPELMLPSLSEDFVYNFQNFNTYYLNNCIYSGYGANPVSFIKNVTLEYNKRNRLHPIKLIDWVHYEIGKQKINNAEYNILQSNQVLLAQIVRFNPEYTKQINPQLLELYPSSSQFWNIKNSEILKDLIKSRFILNTSNVNQPELKYLRNNYPEWINQSGNLILAKLNIDGNVVNIVSETDLIKITNEELTSFIDTNRNNIVLNPLIAKCNYFDYLFTQEFMNTTVGSFIAHPTKGKFNNVLEQEAAHFQAQHKRNVSMTAAMHPFQLNLLNGIPEEYNIAVIEDIKDYQGTITGILNEIKPFDGATFVSPFIVILENNSLGGAKAGITKKQFVHFKDEATGTGGIIKTAGFGLTNDWIRNSPFMQIMMEKMTNHVWLNEDGTLAIVNITKNYKGNNIIYKPIYFKQGDKIFRVNKIISNGNNTYSREIQEVSIEGEPIGQSIQENSVPIRTNYDLWNYFGGAYSMSMNEDLQKLEFSNTSVENVVTAMNSIGTVRNEGEITTQNELWQPLKRVDVHYVATAGAVKQGGANINSASKYTDAVAYDIQKIKVYQAGIQLDKEHHADQSELSLMTQVISACASRGFTFESASRLYDALRTSTDVQTKKFLEPVKKLFTTGTQQDSGDFQEIFMQTIIDSLSRETTAGNFAQIIADKLVQQAKKGDKIKFSEVLLPLSDNYVFSKVLSTISVYLTNTGIRQKVPGILSVLTPSHDIFKLYAGRKYESFINPQQELEELQAQQIPVYDINDKTSNISNLELGRTYLITREYAEEIQDENGNTTLVPRVDEIPQLIQTPQEYKDLKEQIQNGVVTRVVEDVTVGRNLAGYNVRFSSDTGERFQLWDLDSSSTLFELNELKERWRNSEQDIADLQNLYNQLFNSTPDITPINSELYLQSFEVRVRRMLQNDLSNISPSSTNILDQYNNFISTRTDTQEWYNRYACWVNLKLGKPNGKRIRLGDQYVTVTSENFGEIEQKIRHQMELATQVRVKGNYIKVDKSSIKEQAYEIIMPKTFATNFGLSEFDSLDKIANDPDYFIKQYLRNQNKYKSKQQLV